MAWHFYHQIKFQLAVTGQTKMEKELQISQSYNLLILAQARD